MNSTQRLDHYLAAFSQRLQQLTKLRGAAVVVMLLLVIGGIGAWFSLESGFASTTTNAFRVLLVLGLVFVALRFWVDPLQKIKNSLSGMVEQREPSFQGRIETYAQMKAENNPFLDLLAEDALKISNKNPVISKVPQKEFTLAGGVLGVTAAVFLYLLFAGPGLMNYSLRNLLFGWAIPDMLPPQSITVTPGDQNIRRGTNVRINAVMEGFSPDDAEIHIQGTDGAWQQVAMVKSPVGYDFTFFALQQDTHYYVSAANIRSPEFTLGVVEVPGIEQLELTYNFPEWTAREPEVFTKGDIDALPDTRIGLKLTTTAPLSEGLLVLNGSNQKLSLDGNVGTTEFTVTQEGVYYLAAVVGTEEVRLSDDYFIRIAKDAKPELKITKPGGDYNASSIEEVLARIEAKDDYGIQSLALQYSVNSGDFIKVDLLKEPGREVTAEHMFMLEEMRVPATEMAGEANVGQFNVQLTEDEADPKDAELVPLQPGDVVMYYAEATDHTQTLRTDMFFIQVQPYNRRFSQSQMSGGGGGGGGGGQQEDEISKRQRQIIVSTWNLIREQAEEEEASQVEVNSKLLSELQATLSEQAKTLADRARARGLDSEPGIRNFVNYMDLAVENMQPASEKLAAIELNDAIKPAQEALQYLLRAEAVFNDITVSQQQGGGGGGGNRAGQDLAEMFELEMDLSLNQYETGDSANGGQQQQEQAEDIMKQLDELAKRQEQLANNLRNQQQLTDAQRYQQEMLRREAERLQEQLQQLQRSQQQQQSQQGGQQQAQNAGQQGQSSPGQQGQPGQAGQTGQSGQNGQQSNEPQQQVAQSELQRRMESALRAMNQAQQGMEGNLTPEEMQRAAQEASRQLQGARDQIAQDQTAGMQQAFDNMAALGDDLQGRQERLEQQLQQAMQKALKDRESGADADSTGLTLLEEQALAAEKRQLAADLQRLQQQMTKAAAEYATEQPAANQELQLANSEMTQSGLQEAVGQAAEYIDNGLNLYITSYESAVTNAVRNLSDRLDNAQELVASNMANSGNSELDQARQQVADLREQLQQLAQGQPGNQPGQGQSDPNGQQPSDQQGQPGQGQQTVQQGQPGQQGQQGQGQQGQQGQQGGGQQGNQQANNGGGGGNGDRFGGARRAGGAWNGVDNIFNGPIDLPENFYDNLADFTRQARDALPGMDLTAEQLNQMYEMLRRLEGQQANRNDAILAQEYGAMLALIEQLEVGLERDKNQDNNDTVRSAQNDAVPEEYQESVAEYFRRLSRDQ